MHTRTELAASCSQKKKKEKEPGQWNLRIEGEGKRTDTQHIAVLRLLCFPVCSLSAGNRSTSEEGSACILARRFLNFLFRPFSPDIGFSLLYPHTSSFVLGLPLFFFLLVHSTVKGKGRTSSNLNTNQIRKDKQK